MRLDYFSNDYRKVITSRMHFIIRLEFPVVTAHRYMQHVAAHAAAPNNK